MSETTAIRIGQPSERRSHLLRTPRSESRGPAKPPVGQTYRETQGGPAPLRVRTLSRARAPANIEHRRQQLHQHYAQSGDRKERQEQDQSPFFSGTSCLRVQEIVVVIRITR
jgi:hypothetical protein